MRNTLYTLSILLALSLLGTIGCENDYSGTITGRVLQYEVSTRKVEIIPYQMPMKGLRVYAKSQKDNTIREGFTDCDGYYTIENARFGVNLVRTDIEGSIDVFDELGNLLCKKTSDHGYYVSRQYIDVRKDDVHTIDLFIFKVPETRNKGVTVKVEDAYTGKAIRDAKCDIYEGAGIDWHYLFMERTNAVGEAVFYPYVQSQRFEKFGDQIQKKRKFHHNRYFEYMLPYYGYSANEFTLKLFLVRVAAKGYANNEKQFVMTLHGPDVYYIRIKLLPFGPYPDNTPTPTGG